MNYSKTVAIGLLIAVLGGSSAYGAPTPSPSETQSPSPSPTASAKPSPTSPAVVKPCSVRAAVSQAALGQFYGYVIEVASGKVLLNIRGSETTPSASVLKVVSAAAAMTALPLDYKAKTDVLSVPSEPGTIVLRGGGDHTLSKMTGDSYTTYLGAPRLETLAFQVLSKWNSETEIKKIILDSSFFSGPSYNSAWKSSDRTNGYISHITALQTDSDRANPDLTSRAYSGYRSTDPVLKTGEYFRAALQGLAEGATLVKGKTPKDAVPLTSVSSQKMSTWIKHAMLVSDNTETEFIVRHAAKAAGLSPSFSSIEKLTKQQLEALNIDTAGLVMKDGSGLAQANRVTPKMVAELMSLVAAGHEKICELETYLPVAGKTGTLATRFNGTNAAARNYVTGKSGYIPGLYSLAGTIKAKDGSTLAYAIFARGTSGKSVGYAARGALDTVAARFYSCGAGIQL
jgi:D-alanyl-D-alanine carboxypeptidase/D-alanyl-D-alanine-endopeptidase (penicillin-binding protein 4)